MPNEEKVKATEHQPHIQGPEKSKDKWDQLMAKLDDITDMLRKACEGEKPEAPTPATDKDTAEKQPESGEAKPAAD